MDIVWTDDISESKLYLTLVSFLGILSNVLCSHNVVGLALPPQVIILAFATATIKEVVVVIVRSNQSVNFLRLSLILMCRS